MRLDLAAVLLASLITQLPFEPARTGPDKPVNDPVVVRGCVEGRHLRIVRGSGDLVGLRDIRLKGPKGVMATLKDHQHGYVELTGVLDFGRRDRIDTRKKAKLGKDGKGGTITLAASGEQVSGLQPFSDPVLEVVALTPLGERCPGAAKQ
jgi:hypothetical protein